MNQTIKPAIQREVYDLTTEARQNDNSPDLGNVAAELRRPDELMRAMGFEPTVHMNPLQFLTAVYNDDLDKIFRNEKRKKNYEDRGGIALAYRIECAKTAAKYLHSKPPQVHDVKAHEVEFASQLTRATAKAGERVTRKIMILEEVERISPEAPLAPASYPPTFSEIGDSRLIEHVPQAEGNTDYVPDRDDA